MEGSQQIHEVTKITDFFLRSPGKSPIKGDLAEERKLSDILPTPETSPVKDKTQESVSVSKSRECSDPATQGTDSETKDSVKSEKTVTDSKPSSESCKDNKLDKKVSEKESVKIPISLPKSASGKATQKKRGRKKKTAVDTKSTTETKEQMSSPSQQIKSTARKQKKDASINNHLLTDYFPVRRSGRQTVSNIKKDEDSRIEDAVLNGKEMGLKVVEFEGKGRGVIATQDFRRGGFVVEYAGDLIDLSAAREREDKYSEQPDKYGCYMYYFSHKNKSYCIDATLESGRLGRLLNHSKKGNCHTKLTEIKGEPRLILVASRDIQNGEELLYDYGDRSKSSMEAHPWLKL